MGGGGESLNNEPNTLDLAGGCAAAAAAAAAGAAGAVDVLAAATPDVDDDDDGADADCSFASAPDVAPADHIEL